jgi:hypothetical protein
MKYHRILLVIKILLKLKASPTNKMLAYQVRRSIMQSYARQAEAASILQVLLA